MPRPVPAYFDAEWYLQTYPDVSRSGMEPLRHYLRHGRAEGRLPCCLVAAGRERDLRFGFLPGGVADFDPLLNAAAPAERAWAALACARAFARAGDWAEADRRLALLDSDTDLIGGFGLPDDALLAIEAAVMTRRLDRARKLLDLAWRSYGALPDLILARANIAAARHGHGAAWQRDLLRLYLPRGLRGIALGRPGPPGAAAFDRLIGHRLALSRMTAPAAPVVSVIMPARNAGTTIETALHSLQAQSWRALEILVVDNGSTDDTAARVQELAARDARIRLLDAADAPGAYPARNIGLAEATGEFVTVLDADDWAHPARTALQLRALADHPRRMASVSHWVRTTADLRFTRWWGDRGLIHRNVASLMIRTALRDSLGYWDRARAGADTEYYERILAIYGPESVCEVCPGLPLSLGRSSTTSLSRTGATHIASQFYGARRSYHKAARRWHAELHGPDRIALPRHPAQRPFTIPQDLAVGDPPARPRAEDTLQASGVFDDRWYMQTYPDLRARDVDGAAHYLNEGAAEGRDPGPGFSTSGYLLGGTLGADNPVLNYLDAPPEEARPCLPDLPGALPRPAPGAHVLFVGHQARENLLGAERSLLDMLDRAIAAGITPSVLLPHLMNPGYRAALETRCHRIHLRPFGWLHGRASPHPATVEQITALIRDIGAEALHQNTCVLDAPLLAARAARVPTTLHVREVPDQDQRLCFELGVTASELRARILDLADHLVANSDVVARWLDVTPERLTIRPNSIDPALFALPFDPQQPVRVALIGSMIRKKGIADMVTLARMAARRGLPVRFVLVGPSSLELDGLGVLPGNLSHAGYAETPDAALAQADIVLSLSKFAESFGRTVLEAMAAGRPVISYDRGAPPGLVGPDGQAGCIVAVDDPAAVLDALTKIVADPASLMAVSRGARARARAICTADTSGLDASIYAIPPR